MWTTLFWRVAAWFSWTHIQWLMVQSLGPKGLEMVFDRIMQKLMHDKKSHGKPYIKITAADIAKYLDTTGEWQ